MIAFIKGNAVEGSLEEIAKLYMFKRLSGDISVIKKHAEKNSAIK